MWFSYENKKDLGNFPTWDHKTPVFSQENVFKITNGPSDPLTVFPYPGNTILVTLFSCFRYFFTNLVFLKKWFWKEIGSMGARRIWRGIAVAHSVSAPRILILWITQRFFKDFSSKKKHKKSTSYFCKVITNGRGKWSNCSLIGESFMASPVILFKYDCRIPSPCALPPLTSIIREMVRSENSKLKKMFLKSSIFQSLIA